jgi:predicted permease
VLQDLRFAIRLIVKERWYTAVAVAVLALGIGINAIGFTIVNAALIRGLPFHGSGQLYMLAWQARSGSRSSLSHAELRDWRSQSHAFTGLAAFTGGSMNISDDRALPEEARGARLTANAFSVLGQQPLLGRDFAPGEDRKGAELVAILGYRLWKNRYGGDPGVLGKPLRVNGRPATIVGVMPDRMNFPINAEIWTPFIPTDAQESRDNRLLNVFGRLRDDATVEEARTELTGIAQRFATAYPDTNKDLVGARIETFAARFVGGNARVVFLMMMAAVGFVLLIACANVANLLLSRSAQRAREIAIRMALGATRGRVLRQLLLESVVLGAIGGSLGLLIAIGGVRAFDAALTDPGKPYWIVFAIDYVVLGYVAAICLATGLLFGLAPALHVSKTNVHDVLKESGRGNAGGRRVRWFSGTMVVVELALTIVLLVGAGLMIRSFMKLYTLDIGIPSDHLMAMRLQLPDSTYATPEARRAFFDRLEPRLAAIAGVEAAAVTTSVPPFGTGDTAFEIDGRPPRKPDEQSLEVSTVTISPRFFDVTRTRLLRGRLFHDADGAPGSETVIVNARMVSRFFPGEDPLGKRIRFVPRKPKPGDPAPVWRTIVGISPSIRHSAPQEPEPDAVAYVPYRQDPPTGASLLVRSQLPPSSVMDAVRREVHAIDQDQPVFAIETLDQMLSDSRWPFRIFGTLLGIFALVALTMSAVGLYAVMAYSVTQQTQEIGVRMALGAGRRDVSWLVLKRGLVQLGLGLALGLAGAFALTGLLRQVLVQVTPTDPITFGFITTLLTVVSIAACLVPARRATRVDPLVALRTD